MHLFELCLQRGIDRTQPNALPRALEAIQAAYGDLFAFRDRFAPDVRIFGHCYDFPIPNGVHPLCVGPWLKPSLEFAGYRDLQENRRIVRSALEQFKKKLQDLAADKDYKFTLIDTQGTLTDEDWGNELHPTSDGFKKVAQRFVTSLRDAFPGRI